jgi:hypothetical protein
VDLKALLARAADVRTDEVTVDGITVRVREPSTAAHQRYSTLWVRGEDEAALAHLFRHCVINAEGVPCLTDDQALQLARASSTLAQPIFMKIVGMARASEKKPDAPGADAVPDQPAAGAAAE